MIVLIDKIVIKDRIRKDFGDIKELAEDIKQNGLINPPVVNKDYELLAGERRLRACKSLGWKQIEVRMMDTRDAEHELEVEISENEIRKDFSRIEREAIYTRRVEARLRGKFTPKVKEAQEQVAKEMGTSRTNMQHEQAIIDNKELLTPEDFADWDEGRLSTNKAFQMVKARQQELEEENARIRKAKSERETELVLEKQALEKRLAEVKSQKTETVEVEPEDYKAVKAKAKQADAWKKDYQNEQLKVSEKNKEIITLKDQIEELKNQTAQATSSAKLIEGSIYFVAQCGSFVRDMGGYVWIADKIAELPERERVDFMKAVNAIRDWAEVLNQNIENSI